MSATADSGVPGQVTMRTAAILEIAATFFAYGDIVRLLAGSDDSDLGDEVGRPGYELLVAAGLVREDVDGLHVTGDDDLLEAIGRIESGISAELLARVSARAALQAEAHRRRRATNASHEATTGPASGDEVVRSPDRDGRRLSIVPTPPFRYGEDACA
ncbi:MAG TPA: hypothetical protein VH063_18715 [Gaiellaceae bacterium]|jgi:hypothetical protein|nr:hypothetical protein [Gaiellaceae bacterium]